MVCALDAGCYVLFDICCLSFVVYCVLFMVLAFVDGCVLYVVCVVRCVLLVV